VAQMELAQGCAHPVSIEATTSQLWVWRPITKHSC